jgi:hypothetical protein
MSVEIQASLIALLAEVAALKEKEGSLKSEKMRQLEAIAMAEGQVTRCNAELDQIREAQLKAKRSMDSLRDDLFKRDEDEEVIMVDEAHDPSADAPSSESERQRAWRDRQKALRTV